MNPSNRLLARVGIDWGDSLGIDANASVVSDGQGGWLVQDSHYFSSTGAYPVSIQINDIDGASATAITNVDVIYHPGVLNATLSIPDHSLDDQDVQATLYATTTDASGTDWNLNFNGSQTQIYVSEAQYTSFDLGVLSPGSYQIQAHVMDNSGSTDPNSPSYDPGVDLGPDTIQVYSGDFSFSTIPVTVTENDATDWITIGTLIDQNPYATADEFTMQNFTTGYPVIALDASQSNSSQSVFDVEVQFDESRAGSAYYCTSFQDDAGRSAYGMVEITVQGPALILDTSAVPCVAVGSDENPSIVVGQVTDANSGVDVSQLAGTIDWGGGNVADVSFAAVAGSPGTFNVTATLPTDTSTVGDSTYSISVTDSSTGVSAGAGSPGDGGTGDGSGSASVGGPLEPSSPAPGALVEGQGSGPITLDQISVPGDANSVTAMVDYGDGSAPQPAEVSEVGDGTDDIIGAHAYAKAGDYKVTVTVTESFCTIPPSESQYDTGTSLHVDEAPFSLTPGDPIVTAVGVSTGTITLATLTDQDHAVDPSEFTSEKVDWGDGQTSTPDLVPVDGSQGQFLVEDSHTYADGGDYTVSVEVKNDVSDETTTVSAAAVQLNSLTATDDSDSNNSVTVGGGSSSGDDLYLAENPSTGSAIVDLSADYTPSDQGQAVLWDVLGDDASPTSGSFQGGNPGVTLTPTNNNYDYTVQAGVDANNDGILESSEVSQTINVHLFTVNIEFDNTAATNDDVVMLSTPAYGSDIPANQPELDAAVQVLGDPPPGMTVTLDNPDARLGFGTSAPSSQPTTQPSAPVSTQPTVQGISLPTDGSWTHLSIFGLSQSATIGDASVRVTASIAGRAGGVVLDQKGATVFWFNNASITATPLGTYQLQNGKYTTAPDANGKFQQAINLSAQASVSIAGLDPTAPQLTDLRIGIVQNLVNRTSVAEYANPTVNTWLAAANNGTTTAPLPVTFDYQTVEQGPYNDSTNLVAPLYDQPGTKDTFDQNSLAIPVGLPGGGPATSRDTPNESQNAIAGLSNNFLDPNQPRLAILSYNLTKVTINDSFRDWVVVYDVQTKQVIAPLRETTWVLQVDSSVNNVPQQATASVPDFAPTDNPVLSPPFAKDVNGASQYIPVGNATWTFTDPNIVHN